MATYVHTCGAERHLEEELAVAFAQAVAAGANALIVVFPAEARLSRELVPTIAVIARQAPSITALGLVHDSPTLSFIASSLALQLQGVRVRSATTADTTGL